MGYTHYWKQRRTIPALEWVQIREDLATLCNDVQHVQSIPLADWEGAPGTSPEFSPSQISFNGVGDDSHESFVITRKRIREEWQTAAHAGSGFCKTARKPYDLAVTAALCYLATVAETHTVSSDGHGANWLEGLAEARRALPKYANVLDIPRGILEDDRWIGPWASLRTSAYSFHFCVDGFAYIGQVKTGAWYRFPSHTEAAQFFQRNEAILHPTGWFDEARNRMLARQQSNLFAKFFQPFEWLESNRIAPPAFVRPGAFPAMEESRYLNLDSLLATIT